MLASDAAELLAQAHLDRLHDRVRHALPSLSDTVGVCRRFRFNGDALPPHIRPNNCWWFTQSGDDPPTFQCKPSRGPPRGVRRTCYTHEEVALSSIFQIDWQDITAVSVLQSFAWWNYQTSLRGSGLDVVLAECTSRPRAPPSDEESPMTLHIWDLPNLARGHVERVMEESGAWQLTYDAHRMAVLPPWRIPDQCTLLMTEHEAQLLLRRPKLSHIMRVAHALIASRQWDTIVAGVDGLAPALEQSQEAEVDNFRDDNSVLSDVTPDASYMSDSAAPSSLVRR